VRGEGGVGVGAGGDGAIIIIILGKRDPLGSGELLFQMMSDGLLHLLSEGSGMLTRPVLVQGFVCSRHSSDESLCSLCAAAVSSSFLLAAAVVASLLEKRFIVTLEIHYWCRLVIVPDTNNGGLTTRYQ
jgi:hypothetical protein